MGYKKLTIRLGSDKLRRMSTKNSSPVVPTRIPVVEFEYPDSSSNHMKTRYVRVTEANFDYIKGYELNGPASLLQGTYKQYSRNRIAKNGVALIIF